VSILLVVLISACFAVWVAILSARWGGVLAATVVATSMTLVAFAVLVVTTAVDVDIVVAEILLFGVLATTGAAVALRTPAAIARPSASALTVWISASIGGLLWGAARVAADLVPGASAVGWAMEGDATNNLHFARVVIGDNGIRFDGSQNPVPVVASALALALHAVEAGTGPDRLATDLVVFGWVWIAALALCSVVAGLFVASMADRRRPVLVALAGVSGSLLPLTWLVAGLPIEYGYLNVHFTLPLLLASWLAFIASRRAPRAALLALVNLSTLLLLTWSPVLLIPVALGLVVAIRHRRAVISVRGLRLAALGVAVAAFVAVAAALTVPQYIAQSDELSASGHGYPLAWSLALPVIAVALVAALRLRAPGADPLFAGVAAAVAASFAALGVVAYASRDAFDAWSAYYPSKLVWLVAVMFLIVATGVVVARLSALPSRILATASVALAGVVGLGVASYPVIPAPDGDTGYVARGPVDRLLGGHVWSRGDESVRVITELARREQESVLWESASPDEMLVNYWILDAAGGELGGDEALRELAFAEYGSFRHEGHRDAFSEKALCVLLTGGAHSLVVYTDEPALEDRLTERCGGSSARFVVGGIPGLDRRG
jgi:hypothetical protein